MELKNRRKAFQVISALSGLGLLAVVFSCAPAIFYPTEPPSVSAWHGKYAMTFNPPEKKQAAEVPVTIAVVQPSYKGEELSESALADPVFAKVAKGFAASMGNDLDKILIAKGVTTMGPYASREEITYNEKKGASVVLAPQVLLTTQVKYSGDFQLMANGPSGNAVRKEKLDRFVWKFMQAYTKSGIGSPAYKKVSDEWAAVVSSGMPKEEMAEAKKEWARRFASGELIASEVDEAKKGGVVTTTVSGAKGTTTTTKGGGKTKRTAQGWLIATAGSAEDASFGLARYQRDFTMTTSGWMYFIMQEPLSGEKMWVKKLELEPIEVSGTEAYAPSHNMITIVDPCIGPYDIPQGLKVGEHVVFDGRADGMATTLQKMYPIIMKKFETFLDPAEIEGLKIKGKEIREHKVY